MVQRPNISYICVIEKMHGPEFDISPINSHIVSMKLERDYGAVHKLRDTGRGEGSSQFITILQWGGVSRDPKFVLRNIWMAPYEVQRSEKSVCLIIIFHIFLMFEAEGYLGANRDSFNFFSCCSVFQNTDHIPFGSGAMPPHPKRGGRERAKLAVQEKQTKAKDTALSRRRHGFESRWECHRLSACPTVGRAASPWRRQPTTGAV